MTTRSKVMAVAAFGLVATVGISGCAGSESDGADGAGAAGSTPKDKVLEAFTNHTKLSSAGYTLALNSTKADLQKISAAQPKTGGDDVITASDIKDFEQVLGGKLVVNQTAPDGQTFADMLKVSDLGADSLSLLKDPAKAQAAVKAQGSMAISAVLNDSSLVDFVTIDGVMYLRADAEKIATMSGLGSVSDAQALLGQLPPSIATPAKAALDGGWVSLDLIESLKVLNQQGVLDELPKEAVTPSIDPNRVQTLVDSLQAAVEADAQVTEVDGGDQGDGYRVTVPIKKIAAAVQDDLIAVFGQSTADGIKKSTGEIGENETVTVDLFLEDEKLSGLNIDLVQFLQKPVKDATLAVTVDIDPDAAPVKAPDGATVIDVKAILNTIPADTFAGMGAGL
ncbi:hypothetical protein [Kineosporia sp. NBRC 101731]|uniref:hypothetical protein n=1 Tax=Kineosporia sp. NBRC 101731 TaxID=3032199 RepID=UPI0024A292BD|nr:hypothetical protein [Kineosporia sp. NBRC 101731]GLY31576.1 hypothetical protein Kisp02_49410 [Kineosporia sp. NBRC 101731]